MLRRAFFPPRDLLPTARVSPSVLKSVIVRSEKRSIPLLVSAELLERVSVSLRTLKSSEELHRVLELRRLSREHVFVLSFRFGGPEGPLARTENPTPYPYEARQSTALPWVFFPLTYSNATSDQRRACLTRLCCAFRFSQPLDALFRLRPFSLISC